MSCECEKLYRAIDGQIFKTEEECRKHNELPRVWVVIGGPYAGLEFTGFAVKEKAYAYAKRKNDDIGSPISRIDDFKYSVKPLIVNMDGNTSDWLRKLKGLMQ